MENINLFKACIVIKQIDGECCAGLHTSHNKEQTRFRYAYWRKYAISFSIILENLKNGSFFLNFFLSLLKKPQLQFKIPHVDDTM